MGSDSPFLSEWAVLGQNKLKVWLSKTKHLFKRPLEFARETIYEHN